MAGTIFSNNSTLSVGTGSAARILGQGGVGTATYTVPDGSYAIITGYSTGGTGSVQVEYYEGHGTFLTVSSGVSTNALFTASTMYYVSAGRIIKCVNSGAGNTYVSFITISNSP